jgi:hypothetical protein
MDRDHDNDTDRSSILDTTQHKIKTEAHAGTLEASALPIVAQDRECRDGQR